jgi:pimeloyl-ACP methyl ester carboxylesterase
MRAKARFLRVPGMSKQPISKRFAMFGLICLILSACAKSPSLRTAEEFDQPAEVVRACNARAVGPVRLSQHVLVSDSEGNIPKDRHHGDFAEAYRTIMLGYAEFVRRSANPGGRQPRLLFYFNGGLNSQAQIEQQAARQVPCMLADGYYPVFFAWDTEALSSYWEQVSSIWDGQVDHSFTTSARTPLIVLGNVVAGLGQAPVDYFIHGRRFVRALRRKPVCSLVVREDEKHNEALRECPAEQRVTFVDEAGGQISPDANVVTPPDTDAHQLEVGKFATYSLLWPVRMVSTPLAHGLGGAGWTNMLRRTRTTINRSIEFNLNRDVDGTNRCPKDLHERMAQFTKGTGAFAQFFEFTYRYYRGIEVTPPKWRCLGDHEKAEPPPTADRAAEAKLIRDTLAHAEITLIGHSMGAIVINELLERFNGLPYADIVVMASAASLRDTRRVLDRFFEENNRRADTYFYSLMLHPLNDARERVFGGAVPSGSLLMWVDEMYNVAKTPDDKVFGFWPTAKSARRMFGRATQEHMLYRVFSRPQSAKGKPTNPIEHGQFNEDDTCFWRPSFWGVANTTWEERYAQALPKQVLQPCGEKHEVPLRGHGER